MPSYTYEESVRWLRSQPEHSELVQLCYLDEDNLLAAKRFTASEEFAEIVKILRLDKAHTKLKILDLGCGNGIASYAFASLGHDVSAIDPDPSRDVGLGATARLASAVSHGSISTYKAFAEALPFPDATFDVVYARQSLHHFGDLQQGLTECARVLKPGGILLATREHVVNDDEQLTAFFANHILHKLHGGENAYPLERYLSALEQAGVRIAQCLAPFDSVINHFPESNADVEGRISQKLKERFGKYAAFALLRIASIRSICRHRLSHDCNDPGRLYSFLCLKEKSGACAFSMMDRSMICRLLVVSIAILLI